MQAKQVSILEGSTFVVSDQMGDIHVRPDEPAGFFFRDMRHLSSWQLRLNGRELDGLSGRRWNTTKRSSSWSNAPSPSIATRRWR